MFKSLQVLRTATENKSQTGATVPAGTRVVVVSVADDGTITARVQDSAQSALNKVRLKLQASDVITTKRGRPVTAQ